VISSVIQYTYTILTMPISPSHHIILTIPFNYG
jgi:hypothetical protein